MFPIASNQFDLMIQVVPKEALNCAWGTNNTFIMSGCDATKAVKAPHSNKFSLVHIFRKITHYSFIILLWAVHLKLKIANLI